MLPAPTRAQQSTPGRTQDVVGLGLQASFFRFRSFGVQGSGFGYSWLQSVATEDGLCQKHHHTWPESRMKGAMLLRGLS